MASKFGDIEEEKDGYWTSTQKVSNIFAEEDVEDDWVEFGFKSSRSSHDKASSLANTLRSNIDWSSDSELGENKDDVVGWDGSVKYSTSSGQMSAPGRAQSKTASVAPTAPSSLGLSEHMTSSAASGSAVHSDPLKLRAEIQMLKRQLQGIKDRSIEETIGAMLIDKPFYLEQYKSLRDKYNLLDEAISCCDGNVITTVVLFVKRTVKSSIFTAALLQRPLAVTHYLHYLKLHHDYSDYTDILRLCNRGDEAALFEYQRALAVSDPVSRISRLRSCFSSNFKHNQYLALERQLVQDHLRLLEVQQPIEEADAEEEKAGQSKKFKEHPRTSSVINMPVITTLYYCAFYHYGQKENQFTSPLHIKQIFRLSERQYVWTVCNALARLHDWPAIEPLFATKNIFGRRSMKSPIGFEHVVSILARHSAPAQELGKYLRLIDSPDARLALARAHKCHDVVVECLMSGRERQQLVAYRNTLTPHTRGWQCADDALRNSSIKWKN